LKKPFLRRHPIPLSMPRQRKRKTRAPNGGGAAAREENSNTVCALCGRVIQAGRGSPAPVIFSICTSCKRLPHRNPGSTASVS